MEKLENERPTENKKSFTLLFMQIRITQFRINARKSIFR